MLNLLYYIFITLTRA